MKRKHCSFYLLVVSALAIFGGGSVPVASAAPAGASVETIVLIRHGEKVADKSGQLTCKGLNRALALPNVLVGKYGKPDYIFASNPSENSAGKHKASGSHLRPLVTIEPTAIKLGMPVNIRFGSHDIKQLQAELTRHLYANSLIFVTWEHVNLDIFARNILETYGADPSVVPAWPGSDYDTIFVIHLVRSGGKTKATLTVDREGLNDKLSSQYPVLAGG